MHREAEASEKMLRLLIPLGFDGIEFATRSRWEIASVTPYIGHEVDAAQRDHPHRTKEGVTGS